MESLENTIEQDIAGTPDGVVDNVTESGVIKPEPTVEDVKSGGESGDVTNDTTPENSDDKEQVFDHTYVSKLRKESARYREKAKRAEELEKRLHAALVAKDGRLADPGDLEFNPEHLDDEGALAAAISELITHKPGLKAQQLRGDVGAGTRGGRPKPPMDLISIMKGMK